MSVYEIVTGKLLAELERGTVPWRRPWKCADGAPRNMASGREYRGIYALLFGLTPERVREDAARMVAWMRQREHEQSAGAHGGRGPGVVPA